MCPYQGMNLELTDEQRAALIRELSQIIQNVTPSVPVSWH
jgi:hypothetical protein